MLTAHQILDRYISFFKTQGHAQIPNASLVPENDPTTLFTSSGMQPLVPYLLGEKHPLGTRLVNVQNCFRAQDIDEIGDNRHTTFFRMLGNWSLGDYFKKEQLPWFFEFLTNKEVGLGLDPQKLYVTVFAGNDQIPKDTESIDLWKRQFEKVGIKAEVGERIFEYGVGKNWWSRAGVPEKMPAGEPGGPDSEVFYEFTQIEHDPKFGEACHPNCDCGRFMEIGNSVFMEYKKQDDGSFQKLPQQNVDFGGGLERLLAASDDQNDVFKTNLLQPIVRVIEQNTGLSYNDKAREMRIVTDHLIGATLIIAHDVYPSNKEQGYILRRLLRRGLDNWYELKGTEITPIIETIVAQYKDTDPYLVEKFEHIKNTILEEEGKYSRARSEAQKFINKKYRKDSGQARVTEKQGDELKDVTEISADDAFILYTTHGLSPTQIKSLGYTFDDQAFAQKMEEHQKTSRAGAAQRFAGGLADHQERTIMGHTATHLLHKVLRDMFGEQLHQKGSNITTERVRFDYNFDRPLTQEEKEEVERRVNEKIQEDLPVYYLMVSVDEAKKLGAIGLFEEKYAEKVKVYCIGGSPEGPGEAFSKEFCGGPHVEHTGMVQHFKITKEEGLGKGIRRLYSVVG